MKTNKIFKKKKYKFSLNYLAAEDKTIEGNVKFVLEREINAIEQVR